MIDLKDKVAIVTGASSGIGAGLAKVLSAAGAKVAMVARRKEKLMEVSCTCTCETLVIRADLTCQSDREAIVAETLKKWGRIDILFNNAGLGSYVDFMDSTEDDWRKIFEINLFGPVFLTQLVIPTMKKQQSGIIVNVASIAGLFAHMEKVSSYVASKHAMVGFCRGLQKDIPGSGISVYAVCPGLTDTEFFDSSPKLEPIVSKSRKYMEKPEAVAQGIIDQLDSPKLVIFPTPQAAKLYEKQHDNI
jgi:short-subunit dehydrogenase